jgi:hypothetical protein
MAKSESKNRSLDKLEVVSWPQRHANHDVFKNNSLPLLNTEITNWGKKDIVIKAGETCYIPNLFFNKWADGADIEFAKKKITITIKKSIRQPLFKNTDAVPEKVKKQRSKRK